MKATVDIPGDELRDAMRFTKSKTKREAIRLEPDAVPSRFRFLPPYSPDFHPIEQAFAKLNMFFAQWRGRRIARRPTLSPPQGRGFSRQTGLPVLNRRRYAMGLVRSIRAKW